jgi:hypothetical protein
MAIDPAQYTEVAILKALLAAAEDRAVKAQTRLLDLDAEIANLKLTIAKLRRDTFGASSERPSLRRARRPRSTNQHAVRCLHICRANASYTPPTPPAPAVAAFCASWAKTSPRPWSWSPRPGK